MTPWHLWPEPPHLDCPLLVGVHTNNRSTEPVTCPAPPREAAPPHPPPTTISTLMPAAAPSCSTTSNLGLPGPAGAAALRQAHQTDGRPVLESRSSWNSHRRGGAFQNSLRNVVEDQDQGGNSGIPAAGGRDRVDGGEYDEDRAARQMQDIMNSSASSGSGSRSNQGRFGLIKGRMRSLRSIAGSRWSGSRNSGSSGDGDDSTAVSIDPNNFNDSLGSWKSRGQGDSVNIMNFGVSCCYYDSKRGSNAFNPDSSLMSSMNSYSEQVDDDGFLGWDRSSSSMNKSGGSSKDKASDGPATLSRELQQPAFGPTINGSGSSGILTQFKRLSFPKRSASDPSSANVHADFQAAQIRPQRRASPNLGGGGLTSLFRRSKSGDKVQHSFQINKDDAADFDIHEMRREILENNGTDRMSGTGKVFGFLDIGLQE